MKDVREMGAFDTFKQIPNRFISLIYNMISRWGLMLGFTLYLLMEDKLNEMNALIAWIVFSILFLFKSDGIELLKDLVGKVRG
jgi:hypothetical protein